MPKRIIKDRVRFLMPCSRELQFAAMAVVQTYVNDYEKKIYFLGMQEQGYRVELEYLLEMTSADWHLFQDIGIKLDKQPTYFAQEDADAEIDLTELRLQYSWRQDQHVAQIYGSMIGVETTVLPKIKQVAMGAQWYRLENLPGFPLPEMDGDTLVRAADGQIGGIVGRAGWETYLACSMGLPVVEIKPPERLACVLSKWSHKYYRMVDGSGDVNRQINRALLDLEPLCAIARK